MNKENYQKHVQEAAQRLYNKNGHGIVTATSELVTALEEVIIKTPMPMQDEAREMKRYFQDILKEMKAIEEKAV